MNHFMFLLQYIMLKLPCVYVNFNKSAVMVVTVYGSINLSYFRTAIITFSHILEKTPGKISVKTELTKLL